jgi:1-deoxy-D-xylulose-5-phosphate synthase
MDRGSLSPDDGATHHGLFDIAYLHPVPNMIHMVPKDEDELADMLLTATEYHGPIAIRYPRGNGPGAKIKQYPQVIQIGKAEVIKEGQQISIWAIGNMLEMAADVAKDLEARGYSVSIINARFTKPLDTEMLETYARKSEFIITMEDHVIKGGFGSIVLEALNDLGIQIPVVRLGWPDEFVEHGSQDKLREKFGVTKEAVLEKCEPLLAQMEKYDAKATRNGSHTKTAPITVNRG